MTPILLTALLAAPSPGEAIKNIRDVGPGGEGSARAAEAWRSLSRSEPGRLPAILAGFDGASPLAKNWLRSAVSAVAGGKGDLPEAELEKFLLDREHDGEARYLAFGLLGDGAPEKFLPKMLDDPSPELRRAAVARLTGQADQLLKDEEKPAAVKAYRRAFESARDPKQIVELSQKLKTAGEEVDLVRHFALIVDWDLIGPFDYDPKEAEPTYPPEKEFDADKRYAGKGGEKVGWTDFTSDHSFGMVDLNKALKPGTKQVAYARALFTAKEATGAEIRLGSFTKFQLWLNGEMVLDRADAYTGLRLDHYKAPVKLSEGENVILLKVYQAEPPPQLPQKLWQFLLRVSTPEGVGILSADREKE